MVRSWCTVGALLGLVACTELLPGVQLTSNGSTGMPEPGSSSSGEGSTAPDGSTTLGSTTFGSTSTEGTSTDATGWTSRREITLLDPPVVPIADVPVRIRLDSDNFDFGALLSAPDDIRFLDGDGVQILPHEIDHVEADALEIWVRVPLVTEPTTILMDYGHLDPPSNTMAPQVWAGAVGVWHLGGNLDDSSGDGNDGPTMNSIAGAGAVGLGHYYDGSVWDALPASRLGSAAGSIQLWFQAEDDQDDGVSAMIHASDEVGADLYGAERELYFAILHSGSTQGAFHGFGVGSSMDPGNIEAESVGDWLDGQWHHVVMSWNAAADEAWFVVDGVSGGVDQGGIALPSDPFDEWIRLGNFGADESRGFRGTLDEVRLSQEPLTMERAEVEFWAQSLGTAQVGPPQPAP